MDNEDSLIFVSIAAYRDLQLVPTVEDCLQKASNPELLRFGVCWQHGPDEPAFPYSDDPRFRVLDVDWRESQGACWARAEIMKLWQGEDWFLQIDSHCRFATHWDTRLLEEMVQTNSERPILTTYAAPFVPGRQEVLAGSPLMIAFQSFTSDGLPKLKPAEFPAGEKPSAPVRARFLSAGFLFTLGLFVEEVPYDPELYFMGEESSMTVRAFTTGYDLFHPHESLVWHDYLRNDARKHWGDHNEENFAANTVGSRWSDRDKRSRNKVQLLLRGNPVDSFGLGTKRSLADYEQYAGLSFRLCKAQLPTVRGLEPPNAEPPVDWAERILPWIAKVTVPRNALPAGALDDPAFWYLGILDDQGYEITRVDLEAEKLVPLRGDSEELVLFCEFLSETSPQRWTLWPLSRSRGWLDRLEGKLPPEDCAVLEEEA
ncbi:GlcNAc-transferase family protein [Acidipila sp. EB88]|uniref:GlcNAc-transferase family protein n=1 Tax=Acidipila sp. EB88 TaxID=2305226 RepID=UPI000F5F81E8|nr:GlcNAc-transferase family protein [Acidipila sp. EB88]RRA48349.1 hypothetical protein D1Y84_08665 [Acidipila sp. EB88]